ncbi:MAG: hypothetical protein Q9P01_15270 [Anaerolineae bacterium]|nr:hypothetical protein [Anaerolineae bacterium]MDQ7036137.1 hypothetical protein [Anaerolineae bacterium]
MGIGDIMALVSFIFGMIIAYPALLIFLNLLISGRTSKAAHRLNRGMKLPFFVGLIIATLGGFAVVALLSVGSVLQFFGVVLYLILSFWGTIGIAGLARVFGDRLAELSDKNPSPLYKMLSGGAILSLAFAFPLIGWFVLLPIGTIIGLGAATLSLVTRIPKNTPDETVNITIS